MGEHLSDGVLSQLSSFIADRMGLHFPKERWRDLERGIRVAARELNADSVESWVGQLMGAPLTRREIEILAGHLTVGETYFFREWKALHAVTEDILPELVRARHGSGRLRIWSAGCATGEEPYSVAILLSETIPHIDDWNVTILATDINARFLQKAAAGVYSSWSFRSTPQRIKDAYFRKSAAGRFELLPRIKQMVTFAYLNLVEDPYPALLSNTNAMDIIFCRNVLMYFAPERASSVVEHFHRCLVEGGWLVVSPSEYSHVLFSPFVPVSVTDATLYQKTREGRQVATAGRDREVGITPIVPTLSGISATEVPQPAAPAQSDASSRRQPSGPPPAPDPRQAALELYAQGRYTEAADRLLDVLSRDPADANGLALLARSYANQGRLDEAGMWCERAIAADRLNAGYHYLLATILQERGQIEEAVAALKRALYLDQRFVLAHVAMGNLALKRARVKEARKHFANALALLSEYRHEEPVPEAEGIPAGRLIEIIRSTAGDLNGHEARSR